MLPFPRLGLAARLCVMLAAVLHSLDDTQNRKLRVESRALTLKVGIPKGIGHAVLGLNPSI